jgi:hypothetical protein
MVKTHQLIADMVSGATTLRGGVGPVRARLPPTVHHQVAQLAGGAALPHLPRRVGVQTAQHGGRGPAAAARSVMKSVKKNKKNLVV